MLTKNVYILYPAGYGGSYVNWAINISDLDTRNNTVSNPINNSVTNTYGGVGTSHLHVRIPAHQGYPQHVNWLLYNRPTEPKIYIINFNNNVEKCIAEIMQYDPVGICIVIHDDHDSLVRGYGNINCVTKWPSFIAAYTARRHMPMDFDPFNISNDRKFRNWAVVNDKIFFTSKPIDFVALSRAVDSYRSWFAVRNTNQPHEVNLDTYLLPESNYANRIHQFSCLDVATGKFPTILQNILYTSGISDNYDMEYLNEFHQNYIDVQKNLQWFDSYRDWDLTGNIDSYILSHSGIQAQLINHIFSKSNRYFLTTQQQDTWQAFYARIRGNDWPPLVLDQHDYYDLPEFIKKEIQDIGFDFTVKNAPIQAIVQLEWESLDIHEINHVYQSNK